MINTRLLIRSGRWQHNNCFETHLKHEFHDIVYGIHFRLLNTAKYKGSDIYLQLNSLPLRKLPDLPIIDVLQQISNFFSFYAFTCRILNIAKKTKQNTRCFCPAALRVATCLVFLSKVDIWNVNCAWPMAFTFDTQMFLWKCQSFWGRKCIDLRRGRTLNIRIHAECSHNLSYQGQTFAVWWFEHWLWWYRPFQLKLTFEILNVRGQQHTWTDVFVNVSTFLKHKMSRTEGDSIPQPPDSYQML